MAQVLFWYQKGKVQSTIQEQFAVVAVSHVRDQLYGDLLSSFNTVASGLLLFVPVSQIPSIAAAIAESTGRCGRCGERKVPLPEEPTFWSIPPRPVQVAKSPIDSDRQKFLKFCKFFILPLDCV